MNHNFPHVIRGMYATKYKVDKIEPKALEGFCKYNITMAIIPPGYILIDRIDGITQKLGKSAGIELNHAYTATDPSGAPCVLMHCNPGEYVIIDSSETLEKLRSFNGKTISWFIMVTGYAGAHVTMDGKSKVICMHQLLMNHYGAGRGQISVDHINTNKLDNRLSNLRLANQSLQNQNRGKVSRHKNARQLPDGITADMIPKFVVYYKETINDTSREFFTVEGHPIQNQKEEGIETNATSQLTARRWATSKSAKFTIAEKLAQANAFVAELDKLVQNNDYIISIPKLVKQPSAPKPKAPTKIKQPAPPATPKQWKVLQIYNAIIADNYAPYMRWCETTNELSGTEWEATFAKLLTDVRATNDLATAEPIIRAFIEELRRLRHIKLSAKVNERAAPIDREDRQQWPATSVLKAYKEGKLAAFKSWLAKHDNDQDDSAATRRWEQLSRQLESDMDDTDKTAVISKFMTARRARKARVAAAATA